MLSILITSCKLSNEISSYYNDIKIDFSLPEDQKKLIGLPSFCRKILNESCSKLSWNYSAKLFSHFSFKNLKFSMELMNVIFEELSVKDDIEIKPYLRTIEEIIGLGLRGDETFKNFVNIIFIYFLLNIF